MVRILLLLLSVLAIGWANLLVNFYRNVETLYRIEQHNANPARTFYMRYNPISELTPDEYKGLLGTRVPENRPNKTSRVIVPENFKIPDSFDWREWGVVSQVKNQYSCGSCWAFSAVGALEGQHAIKRGKLLEFSEQDLVDCSEHNSGCDGGWPDKAYADVKNMRGIDSEESYPYANQKGECRFKTEDVVETDEGYVDLVEDEYELKKAVATIGPMSVAIVGGIHTFQSYGGGVFYDPECNKQGVDHAVLVVGYGTDPVGGDYWIVKNSWGASWGEDGYIRMARNRDNNCFIASYASFPIVV